MASNSQQPYSRGYEPSYETVQLTFSDAVWRVSTGAMEPMELFSQLPDDLKMSLEDFARASQESTILLSGKDSFALRTQAFAQIPKEKQIQVLESFLKALNAQSKPPAEMTFAQAVEHVLRDEMKPEDLLDQLPGELQATIQLFSQTLLTMGNPSPDSAPVVSATAAFATLTTDRQKFVLQSLLQAMTPEKTKHAQPG